MRLPIHPTVFQRTVFFFMYTDSDFHLHPGGDLATVNNNASNPGRCFRINITEDGNPEPAENFTINFMLNRTQPEGVNISSIQHEAVITIQDNDSKSHWFQMIGVRELHVCQLQKFSDGTVLHHADMHAVVESR